MLMVMAGAGAQPAAPASPAALIEAGRYLAAAGDCVSCHTQPDGQPFAGGVAIDTPFGVIFSANITPDPGSGIGSWSEPQFARALREGIAADGRHLYPAFPYTAYSKITDQDVHAIYAYLRSLKPVRYTPPANRLLFPFGLRSLLAVWNLLFFEAGRYAPDDSKSAQWNRGAYLVQALGHCGACHTPHNALGAERHPPGVVQAEIDGLGGGDRRGKPGRRHHRTGGGQEIPGTGQARHGPSVTGGLTVPGRPPGGVV